MATRLVHPPIPAPHLLKQQPKIKTTQITLSAPAPRCNYSGGLNHCPFVSRTKQTLTRAASEEQRSGLLEDPKDSIALTKSSIYQALKGINRGVFGVTSAKRREIEDLVMQLESQNPTPNPILNLEKVSGSWKLIYSTITILGPKRTKLGLRDFITLGDFLQIIDVTEAIDIL